MKTLVIVLFRSFLSGFRNRQSLVLENAALRQQLDVLQRQVKRPRLTGSFGWRCVECGRAGMKC